MRFWKSDRLNSRCSVLVNPGPPELLLLPTPRWRLGRGASLEGGNEPPSKPAERHEPADRGWCLRREAGRIVVTNASERSMIPLKRLIIQMFKRRPFQIWHDQLIRRGKK